MTYEDRRAELVAQQERLKFDLSALGGAIQMLDILIKERDEPQESVAEKLPEVPVET